MENLALPKSCIYIGKVMHARLVPKVHKFRYGVFSLLLDLDQLNGGKLPSLLKVDKWGLISFYRRDHGRRDGSDLKHWVNELLKKASQEPAEKIFLLSFPRIFGFGFSPLSVFFCYRKKRFYAVIYEVKNTFGDQIAYTLPILTNSGDLIMQEHDKQMYVSPFIEIHLSVITQSESCTASSGFFVTKSSTLFFLAQLIIFLLGSYFFVILMFLNIQLKLQFLSLLILD